MILVTTYINPDLDGFSGAMAYAEFLNKSGRPAQARFSGDYQTEVKFAAEKFRINLSAPLENYNNFDQIVLVDVSDLKRLDKNIDPQKVIEVIDHREVVEFGSFPNAEFQVEVIGASATLVGERIIGREVSETTAKLLIAAIIYHTINFQAPDVTRRDRDIVARLKSKCNFPSGFIREIFAAKSDLVGFKLADQMKDDLKSFDFAGKKVAIALLETIDAAAVVRQRGREIIALLQDLKSELKLDLIFLAVIDLEKLVSFIISAEPETQELLKKVFNLQFKDYLAKIPKLIRRKGLTLHLKEYFEKQTII